MGFFRHLATQLHVLSSKAATLTKFKVHNSNHGFTSIN